MAFATLNFENTKTGKKFNKRDSLSALTSMEKDAKTITTTEETNADATVPPATPKAVKTAKPKASRGLSAAIAQAADDAATEETTPVAPMSAASPTTEDGAAAVAAASSDETELGAPPTIGTITSYTAISILLNKRLMSEGTVFVRELILSLCSRTCKQVIGCTMMHRVAQYIDADGNIHNDFLVAVVPTPVYDYLLTHPGRSALCKFLGQAVRVERFKIADHPHLLPNVNEEPSIFVSSPIQGTDKIRWGNEGYFYRDRDRLVDAAHRQFVITCMVGGILNGIGIVPSRDGDVHVTTVRSGNGEPIGCFRVDFSDRYDRRKIGTRQMIALVRLFLSAQKWVDESMYSMDTFMPDRSYVYCQWVRRQVDRSERVARSPIGHSRSVSDDDEDEDTGARYHTVSRGGARGGGRGGARGGGRGGARGGLRR
jgi:hypothetical protein